MVDKKSVKMAIACAALVCTSGAFASAEMMMAAKPSPAMQAVLTKLAMLGGKPIETLTPQQARLQPSAADAVARVAMNHGISPLSMPVGDVADSMFHAGGADIPIRIYTPPGSGPFPVLVYYHGGGWVLADINAYDASARALAVKGKTIVVSVGYRLAPEHKFPVPADDAYAGFAWVTRHAASFNGDAKRVSVGGESAGGNLATVVAMMARDKHAAMPIHELLIYPVTNYAFDTPSYEKNAMAKPLNRAMMRWFFKHYLRTPADGARPYVSPLRATSLANMPPATVITDDIDPLMSEGKAYADKLAAAGVPVRYKNYSGVTHEFFGMGAVVPTAVSAEAFAGEQLRYANQVEN